MKRDGQPILPKSLACEMKRVTVLSSITFDAFDLYTLAITIANPTNITGFLCFKNCTALFSTLSPFSIPSITGLSRQIYSRQSYSSPLWLIWHFASNMPVHTGPFRSCCQGKAPRAQLFKNSSWLLHLIGGKALPFARKNNGAARTPETTGTVGV